MLVYLILPILAYMLTGCSDDDGTPNYKVSNSNNPYTVFYGIVSGPYINIGEVFTDVPILTGITFLNNVRYTLVESTSSTFGNAKIVSPIKSFTIKGDQTVNSGNSYILDVTSTAELPSSGTFYFTYLLGDSVIEQPGGAITWNH
jgi:hypothetical protein